MKQNMTVLKNISGLQGDQLLFHVLDISGECVPRIDILDIFSQLFDILSAKEKVAETRRDLPASRFNFIRIATKQTE